MSHSKERHEKICLNCNAELSGRFCHLCGQENIEPKESVWGLISHFFYDITHFDGKFFSTTSLLIKKPGYLPAEYIKGRRARYLHPIRMYVFSSAVFFLIFFSLFKPKNFINNSWADTPAKIIDTVQQLTTMKEAMLNDATTAEDSAIIMGNFSQLHNKIRVQQLRKDSIVRAEDSIQQRTDSLAGKKKKNKLKRKVSWDEASSHYKTVEAYDSAQKALPREERDGWWAKRAAHRNIELANHYREDETKFFADMIDTFLHMLPYMLFISLPLYAFFMKLLYFRHKQFYYVDHGIFFIYLYIFTFIFMLIYFSLVKLRQYTEQNWIGWFEAVLFLGGIYYAYKAMRKFYGQSRSMTVLKFILLNIMAFFALILLFVFFFTLTIFKL